MTPHSTIFGLTPKQMNKFKQKQEHRPGCGGQGEELGSPLSCTLGFLGFLLLSIFPPSGFSISIALPSDIGKGVNPLWAETSYKQEGSPEPLFYLQPVELPLPQESACTPAASSLLCSPSEGQLVLWVCVHQL